MANTRLDATFVLKLLQTSSILSSFFLAMTLNPEVQIRARENIDSVLGPNNLPTFADRERLPYIDCIIKELIRWHPPAPLSTIYFTFCMLETDEYSIQLGAPWLLTTLSTGTSYRQDPSSSPTYGTYLCK